MSSNKGGFPVNSVDNNNDKPSEESFSSPKLLLTRKVLRGGIQHQQNNNTNKLRKNHKHKTIKAPRKRSPCGAPIPSFNTELDRLEKELLEDDEEERKRRHRKEQREQRKLIDKQRIQSLPTTKTMETIDLLSSDDEDDAEKLLNFDFRGLNNGSNSSSCLSTAQAKSSDHGSVNTSREETKTSTLGGPSPSSPLKDDGSIAGFEGSFHSSPSPLVGEPTKPKMIAKTLEPKSCVESTLESAVREIFLHSNIHTCTVKQVCKELEEKLGIKLDKAKKKAVRERLTALLEEQQHQTMNLPLPDPALNTHSEMPDTVVAAGKVKAEELDDGGTNIAVADPMTIKDRDPSHVPIAKTSVPICIPTATKIAKSASNSLTVEPELPVPTRRGRKPKAAQNGNSASTSDTTSTAVAATGIKRRAPAAASSKCGTSGHTSTAATTTTNRAPPKRKKGNCTLCNNCPCQSTAPATISTLNLAQSDAAVEKALLRRLQKLEQISDRYEEQTEVVRRKLKKHRREMWRKLEPPQASNNARQSRFLPDVEEMNRHSEAHPGSAPLGAVTVGKARAALFSYAATYQPTLTQMLGCRTKKEEEGDKLDSLAVASKSELEPVVEETATQLADEVHSAVNSQDSMVLDFNEEEVEGEECCTVSSEREERVDFQRVEIRNGVDASEESTRIWGAYATAGDYKKCLWDRIFEDPAAAEDLDLEQLETLMEEVQSQQSSRQPGSPAVQYPMLTQRGRLLADEIVLRISSDQERITHLDSVCPKWKENVLFALHQKTCSDVSDALERVREEQARLRCGKEALLKAIESREVALDLFAEALTQSLTRFDGQNDLCQVNEQPSVDAGFTIFSSSPCRVQEASQVSSYPIPGTSEASPVVVR